MGGRDRHRKEGYQAFSPGENQVDWNPYRINHDPYPNECWAVGWNAAKLEYDDEQARLGIGYIWEDPECDLIAAVRQIQEILDEQLRGA